MAAPTAEQLKAIKSVLERVRERAQPLFPEPLEVGMHDIDPSIGYATKRASESFVYYVAAVKSGEKRKLFGLNPIWPERQVRSLCWVYPVLIDKDGAKLIRGQVNDAAVFDLLREELNHYVASVGATAEINKNFAT